LWFSFSLVRLARDSGAVWRAAKDARYRISHAMRVKMPGVKMPGL
jgi:hypothetical protein